MNISILAHDFYRVLGVIAEVLKCGWYHSHLPDEHVPGRIITEHVDGVVVDLVVVLPDNEPAGSLCADGERADRGQVDIVLVTEIFDSIGLVGLTK